MTAKKKVHVPKLAELIREIDVLKQYPCSKTTLWRARKDGRLPWLKVGAFVCYRPKDVEAFFAGQGAGHAG